MISILTPTRGRPANVRRLITSVFSTAEQPSQVELLFYVDSDDETFPEEVISENIRVVRGPRMWLSVLQNILYANCRGEIVMYAGDDLEFKTTGWDKRVRQVFEDSVDKLLLVYPNDLATHGENMAIHGFLHRNWIEAVGCWVAPGRGSLYDLWHTDVARKLGRLKYLHDVEIAHVHYRQGAGQADFDETYQYVSAATRSWVPRITYRKLKRERRIDFILLSEKINGPLKIDYAYFLAEWLVKNRNKFGMRDLDVRRIKSLGNLEIIPVIAKNILKIMSNRRKKSA
jgi:glycosyltransferase involved in cell wall biosynthesis